MKRIMEMEEKDVAVKKTGGVLVPMGEKGEDGSDQIQLSRIQKAIMKLVFYLGLSTRMFGGGGTGKSVLIRAIREFYQKKCLPILVCAPTGIAAQNVGGSTIHTLFRLPPTAMDPEIKVELESMNEVYKQVLRQSAAIVVDETSMARVDLMDKVDSMLQQLMGNHIPFGGKQMILVGDNCQLPPVVKEEEKDDLLTKYGSGWYFAAPGYADNHWITIELTENFRQRDPLEQEILARLRIGDIDQELVDRLNEICYKEIPADHPYPIMSPTNKEVKDRNKEKYETLDPATERVYRCPYSPALADYNVDCNLKLRVGAKVLFVQNDSQKRWVNGTLGVVTELLDECVMVDIDGIINQVDPVEFARRHYELVDGKIELIKTDVTHQYPLRLGWAATIHKVQGMTFDGAYLALKDKAFIFGQIYVAVSRVRSLKNLWFSRKLELDEIKVDRQAIQMMLDAIQEEQERGYVDALLNDMDHLEYVREMVLKSVHFKDDVIYTSGYGAALAGILIGTRNYKLQITCRELNPHYVDVFNRFAMEFGTANIRIVEPEENVYDNFDIMVDMDTLVDMDIKKDQNGKDDYTASFKKISGFYFSKINHGGRLLFCERTTVKDWKKRIKALTSSMGKKSISTTLETKRICENSTGKQEYVCYRFLINKPYDLPDRPLI